ACGRRRPALRADDDILSIYLLVEERQRPELTALRAARDQEQRRQRAWSTANGRVPQVRLLGFGQIESHVVLDPLRHRFRELFELFFSLRIISFRRNVTLPRNWW